MNCIVPSQKAWDILYNGMFHIELNANDFFGYACADSVELCNCDLKWVLPIIEEFGDDGLNACMAYIEDCSPIDERQTPIYHKAWKKIHQMQPLVYSKINEWPREFLDKVSEAHRKGEKLFATRQEQKGPKRHG